jgi:hypothetical protein
VSPPEGRRGKYNEKQAPSPSVDWQSILPPNDSITRRQNVSPMPLPLPWFLVEKNGSKMRPRCCAGMPSAESRNSTM